VDSLTGFLRAKTDLTLLDLLRLWKGLFFCTLPNHLSTFLRSSRINPSIHPSINLTRLPGFYHSDRPLTQQSLARALSYSLVPTLPRATLLRFLRAFWMTISRDFHALDRLRLDKYLFLIRCYVGVGFEVFLKGAWREEVDEGKKRKRGQEESQNGAGKNKKRSKRDVKSGRNGKQQEQEKEEEEGAGGDDAEDRYPGLAAYISILEEGPLYPLDFDPDQAPADDGAGGSVPIPHGPDGLRYHLLDIWVDELEKVLEFEDEGDSAEDGESVRRIKGDVPMELLLRPVETLRAKGLHRPVRIRATETLEDERLVEWGIKEKKADNEDESESEDEWGGFGDD
jgi:ribosomal RNA-processing protein 1